MTVTLNEGPLSKLPDGDLRAIALRILTDAVSALDTSIDEYDLTNHLDPAPVHEAAEWLYELLANPDAGDDPVTRERHHGAVNAFLHAARDIGKATTGGNGRKFPPYLNAAAVGWLLSSVYRRRGTAHRPSVWWLHLAFVGSVGVFIPGHETTVGYALKVLCDSDDPRLPALSESYLQSGLHVNLRPAINRATRQLTLLDELADLNR